MGRQQRITLDGEHFFIDLVFYNRLTRSFVLLDLKVGKLTHQDLGQMQMYVNYYQRELTAPDENPPIGIVLCTDKSEAVVRYALPEGNTQIFASRYKLHLPTEEELAAELPRERRQIELTKRMGSGDGEADDPVFLMRPRLDKSSLANGPALPDPAGVGMMFTVPGGGSVQHFNAVGLIGADGVQEQFGQFAVGTIGLGNTLDLDHGLRVRPGLDGQRVERPEPQRGSSRMCAGTIAKTVARECMSAGRRIGQGANQHQSEPGGPVGAQGNR